MTDSDNNIEVEFDDEAIEGTARVWVSTDFLLEYGQYGVMPPANRIEELVKEGYLFDERANITDKGLDFLDASGVPLRSINTLTLGTDLHIPMETPEGKKVNLHLKSGSVVMVVFGGRDRKTQLAWYDVQAGEKLPILRVYANRHHVFATHRWPVALPITGTTYSV